MHRLKKLMSRCLNDRLQETWHACIVGSPVASARGIFLDWRYFYILRREGRAACGIARRVGAEFLRLVGTPENFLGPQWYDSLKMAGNNPSILGFFVEQVILSWMSISGCPFLGQRFGMRPATILFASTPSMPVDLSKTGFTLYIPRTHIMPAVDAILVSWDGESVEVYGVQITIAKSHSNSEAVFFRSWQSWIDKLELPEGKIRFGFLWIVEDRGVRPSAEEVTPKTVSTRGQIRVVCPAFKRMVMSVSEVSPEIGRKLQVARQRIQTQQLY